MTTACPAFAATPALHAVQRLAALSLLVTLLTTSTVHLFGAAAPPAPVASGLASLGLYAPDSPVPLAIAHVASIVVVGAVASGVRNPLLHLAHVYVAWSFVVGTSLLEGGDQIGANLLMLATPSLALDASWPRRWRASPAWRRAAADAVRPIVRLQVAIVYFHAAVDKMYTPEWRNGTAMYYWVGHEQFGAASWLRPALDAVVTTPLGSAALTWGVIAIELAIAGALVAGRRYRARVLAAGLALHAGIALVHGLWTFGLVMTGALLVLCDWDGTIATQALRRARALLDRRRRARWHARARLAPPRVSRQRTGLHDGTSAAAPVLFPSIHEA
ncbi:MAG: hypothetical protein MUE41_00670 [Gemmatimonadaceae bacterium]|jgi:antimicrobial peptide system SdpB family protein|nr:hypothetical protein [Gemmatimonadaceae bacterium]